MLRSRERRSRSGSRRSSAYSRCISRCTARGRGAIDAVLLPPARESDATSNGRREEHRGRSGCKRRGSPRFRTASAADVDDGDGPDREDQILRLSRTRSTVRDQQAMAAGASAGLSDDHDARSEDAVRRRALHGRLAEDARHRASLAAWWQLRQVCLPLKADTTSARPDRALLAGLLRRRRERPAVGAGVVADLPRRRPPCAGRRSSAGS